MEKTTYCSLLLSVCAYAPMTFADSQKVPTSEMICDSFSEEYFKDKCHQTIKGARYDDAVLVNTLASDKGDWDKLQVMRSFQNVKVKKPAVFKVCSKLPTKNSEASLCYDRLLKEQIEFAQNCDMYMEEKDFRENFSDKHTNILMTELNKKGFTLIEKGSDYSKDMPTKIDISYASSTQNFRPWGEPKTYSLNIQADKLLYFKRFDTGHLKKG